MTNVEHATKAKTRIQLPVDGMKRVKSVSGGVSFHCGDAVAEKLTGLPLDHVKSVAATLGIETEKYGHLNPGQQRMNIGNLIRSHVRKNPDAEPTFHDAADGVREAHAKTVEAANAEKAAAAEARAKKLADKQAAKEAAKAERDAKKGEREAAQAEAKAAREAKKAEREAEKAQKAADREAKKAEREAAKVAKAEAKAAAKAAKAE